MAKKVFGLLGRAGSGKSTAAKFMEERYGAERLSIARPLKRICQEVFDFTDEQVFGATSVKETVDERWGVTPRLMMQKLSVAGREHLGPDVWIRGLVNYMQKSDHDLFVIEDMRFVNEAQMIAGLVGYPPESEIGGYIIKLVCTDSLSADAGTHPSEAEVDKVPLELLSAVVQSHISKGSHHLLDAFNQVIRELV